MTSQTMQQRRLRRVGGGVQGSLRSPRLLYNRLFNDTIYVCICERRENVYYRWLKSVNSSGGGSGGGDGYVMGALVFSLSLT